MQFLFRVLSAALAVTCCAGAVSRVTSAAEVTARHWLSSHGSPDAAAMAELRGQNPEAFAIVQALLTKQSMGLIKRSANHNGLSNQPLAEPLEPELLKPALVYPSAGSGAMDRQYSAEELEALPARIPTAPPPFPPPLPLSSDLPPSLEEPLPETSSLGAPAPSPQDSAPFEPIDVSPPAPRLSAAATGSSVESGHTGNWLNWNPDQMIADNEKMVSNVLGAVAQLTGKHLARAAPVKQESEEPQEEVPPPPAPRRRVAEQEVAMPPPPTRNILATRVAPAAPAPRKRIAPEVAPIEPRADVSEVATVEATKVQSPADLYLASTEAVPAERAAEHRAQVAEEMQQAHSSADFSGHLPGSVSWSNPFTLTSSANVQSAGATQENSYLKNIDLGVPQVHLLPKRTPDDENPYLTGLDLVPSAQPAETSISASSLTAMHQDQLLSSHTLLSSAAESIDWQDPPTVQRRQRQVGLAAKSTKEKTEDVLKGFLGHGKGAQPKNPPAAMVSKNAYLAKLDDAATVSYSASSALASNIEQDNPYLQSLDDPIPVILAAPPPQAAQPNLRAANHAESRDRLASFKWDDSQAKPAKQLAMTSNKVQQQVSRKIAAKKDKHALSGWLGGKTAKAPDARKQRLQQAVAQRVADNKNVYLKGLDIDSGVTKLEVREEDSNPYMASFD